MKKPEPATICVKTVGHSTHSIEEFVKILDAHNIKEIVDVRTIPKSRKNPQFNKDVMPANLGKIKYQHMPGLGGLRHALHDSLNTAWKNASFRGYADYMLTQQFEENLLKLIEIAHRRLIAIMCAEALPWRCHRSLIGDALLVRGINVIDIFTAGSEKPHRLTSFAHVNGTRITYPQPKEP